MKRLATLLIALVAFAGVPATAEAGAPSNATWSFAHRAANYYWQNYNVCPGKPTINYRWRYKPRADWFAWAWIGGDPTCTVTVNTASNWRRVGRRYGRSGRATYCAVIVHEYGHLAGLNHTRRGIMRGDSTIHYPAVCGY